MRPKSQNGIYLSYLLSNKKRLVIAKYAQGDSVVHLYGEKIKHIYINLPTIKEQEKVSKLLEYLSKKIELQKQKIEALKIYKKGLIQKLYNIIFFTVFGWLYMRGLADPTMGEALVTGALWTGICVVFDVFGWVLIRHHWSLTFHEFYIDYQPWITLIYLAIFAGPVIGFWLL